MSSSAARHHVRRAGVGWPGVHVTVRRLNDKLLPTGDLDSMQATPAELRGEALFRGKARCETCHSGEYSTDNLSHDLRVERFYDGRPEGIFKTFSLRGVKDSPPYLHDGRLLTLEDTVEFFNLILGTRLSAAEKRDLVAYLRVL
jgi:cytochrome c peroxidase